MKFQDRDLESLSSDSVIEDGKYDKKTLVKRSHNYEPSPDGDTQRFRTEVTTSTVSKETSKY